MRVPAAIDTSTGAPGVSWTCALSAAVAPRRCVRSIGLTASSGAATTARQPRSLGSLAKCTNRAQRHRQRRRRRRRRRRSSGDRIWCAATSAAIRIRPGVVTAQAEALSGDRIWCAAPSAATRTRPGVVTAATRAAPTPSSPWTSHARPHRRHETGESEAPAPALQRLRRPPVRACRGHASSTAARLGCGSSGSAQSRPSSAWPLAGARQPRRCPARRRGRCFGRLKCRPTHGLAPPSAQPEARCRFGS